jgi:TonB family protein
MIILEFLVFVVTSGLFCSEKFRHHIWAVIVAGIVATGSSLLFVYDLGAKLTGHEKEPPVITRIVKQQVVKTVQTSQPASVGKTHNCLADYPTESLNRGETGRTVLGFKILTDGTVDAIKVLTSSGSERLDEAAVKCVSDWHYRPAIKNGQLAETDWRATVKWPRPGSQEAKLDAPAKPEAERPAAEEIVPASRPPEERRWYDVFGWFSSDRPDAKPDAEPKSPQAP